MRRWTQVASPALCPEVRLHLADDLESLRAVQERLLGNAGLPPPYWAVAWPGGQALARHVLDHPDLVRGRTVLDLGSGSGIGSIAAAISGASRADAAEIDATAVAAIALNASLNSASVSIVARDVIGCESRWDVVLAGDLWYERFLAQEVSTWLRALADAGTLVLAGDSGRAHFPRGGAERLASHEVACDQSLEPARRVMASVWRMGP